MNGFKYLKYICNDVDKLYRDSFGTINKVDISIIVIRPFKSVALDKT